MTLARMTVVLVAVALVAAGCGGTDANGAAGPLPQVTAPTTAPLTTALTTGPPTTVPPQTAVTSPGAVVPTTVAPVPATTTTLPSGPLEGPRTTAAATDDDPVPPGEVLELPGLWDIAVTGVDLDAAPEVLAFVAINPQPEPGYRYVMVTIEGVYLGDYVAQPVFEWALHDGDLAFAPSIPGCGVIPSSLYDILEVVRNERFRANLCVPVPEESVSRGLVLSLQPPGDPVRFFDIG